MTYPTLNATSEENVHPEFHNAFVDPKAHYNAQGDGSTDDTTALQAAIDATPSGGVLWLRQSSSYYRITADLEVASPITIVGPGEIRQATAGQAGFTVTSSGVTLRGLTLIGPQAASYAAGEKAINFTGTSAASPLTDVRVEDCHIYTWGYGGIYAKWANRCHFNRNTIRDVVYAGIQCLSCIQGEASGNLVVDVNPGSGGNCYGVHLTRTETSDLGTDPRTSDWTVSANTIRDIPVWTGIDTHGGQRLAITGNTVYGCEYGIAVGASDNATSDPTYAPLDVSVTGNTVDSGVTNGSASPGIAFTGAVGSVGSPTQLGTGSIIGNTVKGHGAESSALSGGIQVNDTEGLTITGNLTQNPSPAGINIYHDNYGFTCTGNSVIDAWSDTVGVGAAWGVRVSSTYNYGTITGNSWRNGDLAGKTYTLTRGIDVNSSANAEVLIGANYSDASAFDVLDSNALSTAKDYAVTNLVTDRTLDCNANDDLATADVLGTLISDLIALGVLR